MNNKIPLLEFKDKQAASASGRERAVSAPWKQRKTYYFLNFSANEFISAAFVDVQSKLFCLHAQMLTPLLWLDLAGSRFKFKLKISQRHFSI